MYSLPVSPQSTSPLSSVSSPLHSPSRSARLALQAAPFTLRAMAGNHHCKPHSSSTVTTTTATSTSTTTTTTTAAAAAAAAASAASINNVTSISITTTGTATTADTPCVIAERRPSEPRYNRGHIALFRTASGEECPLSPALGAGELLDELPGLGAHPRISSVTASPDTSHIHQPRDKRAAPPAPRRARLGLRGVTKMAAPPPSDEDDCASTYSHASAINLDDLDDDAALHQPPRLAAPPLRGVAESRRDSFARSFARASARKMVPVVPVQNGLGEKAADIRLRSLLDRCVDALAEAVDLNLAYARSAADRFARMSALYTPDEREVIATLLHETCLRVRSEAPTPWRTPIGSGRRSAFLVAGTHGANRKQTHLADGRDLMVTASGKQKHSDVSVRAVVFGAHVVPGLLSAESILLRMAGEYQREEVNRKASRSERVDVPLSFAMTLTAALAAFARLECSTTYRRYRSRNAANRRSNPHALLWLKTKFDGMRLSFGVTLHGESPCTMLFRRPRIFSLRKIDDYATLVTEAKEIISEFGREVSGPRV